MTFLPPNQQYCVQYTLRANRMIQDVNSVFSPDQPCWTSALNYYSVASVSPDHTSAVPRPIYESSVWWTSKEAYETSHNRFSLWLPWRGGSSPTPEQPHVFSLPTTHDVRTNLRDFDGSRRRYVKNRPADSTFLSAFHHDAA